MLQNEFAQNWIRSRPWNTLSNKMTDNVSYEFLYCQYKMFGKHNGLFDECYQNSPGIWSWRHIQCHWVLHWISQEAGIVWAPTICNHTNVIDTIRAKSKRFLTITLPCFLFRLLKECSSRSRFSSVGRASGSQIFWEHEFKSWQPHLCNSMWGQDRLHAGHQEVGKCSTRGGSWGMNITFPSAKKRIRQNPLWLWTPEQTSPEIQNRGTSGPKKGHVCPPKTF